MISSANTARYPLRDGRKLIYVSFGEVAGRPESREAAVIAGDLLNPHHSSPASRLYPDASLLGLLKVHLRSIPESG